MPNRPTGKGPEEARTSLRVGRQVENHLRVAVPGEAADLYRRITGKEHATLKGEPSAGYKSFLKLP